MMQSHRKLETRPLRGPLFIKKKATIKHLPQKIINMDQEPKTSTRILIPNVQPLIKLQLITINIKLTQSALKTHKRT